MFRQDALGVELHAVDRQRPMGKTHHQTISSLRGYKEILRTGLAIHDQGMVAGGLEGAVDAPEDSFARMLDLRHLAMHRQWGPRDGAAEDLADGLQAQTHTEGRNHGRCTFHEIEADPRLVGGAGTW